MTDAGAAWSAWEARVNDLLGLQPTVASGCRPHDPGDGVDRRHHSQTGYALMVDCKHTERGSFSVSAKTVGQWSRRAAEAGKKFAMPVRLADRSGGRPTDVVVVPFDDYVTLLDSYREVEGG